MQQAYQTTSTQLEYLFDTPGIFTYRVQAHHNAGKFIEGNLVTVTISQP